MTTQRTVEDIYPLSPIQQGMLFHTLYAPDSGMYISQTSFQIAGGFDPASFKRALARVIERHAVLRSSFAWKGLDQPVQVVHRATSLPIREEDWSGLPEVERARRLEDYLSRDAVQGFDLDQPPLMRFLLARETEGTFRLVWSLHLLLADGWSTARIIGELFACHEAFRQGLEPRIEPPRRYRDYIAWLARQDSRQAEIFWRRELAGLHEPTPLPGDQGPGRTPSVTEHRALLSQESTEALQGFARANQLTVNTLVQGAWTLLLSRLSGQREVVFGVTISGRPPELPGAETMVGPFINTLPLRAEVAPKAPLGEWLRQLQDRHSEARQFGHVPLVELQGWSELPRGVPLFESLLVFENYPVDTAARKESNGLVIGDFRAREVVNYALTLVGVPGRRLALSFSWDRARFDADAIERLSGYLIRLLEGMALSSATRLESLEHLPGWERHQLLMEWNDGGAVEAGPSLHELFEAQARRRPDAVAVTGERESLTYGELNRRANRLAHHLIALGVSRELPTALCLERSPELVVAILAVLKAGGAYVPLDPTYPPERLRFLLEDCRASLLIAQRQVVESLPSGGERRLFLDDDEPWAGTPETDPEVAIDPRSLAYVIYTSGSTGYPKGVLVPHAQVSRLFRSTATWFGFGERDVWSLFHSYAFDFSVWEIWGALLHGGRLVVVPWWVSRSPERFHELLVREGVTVLNQTPAAFRQLVHADAAAGVEIALRLVIFGGDVLELESLSPWMARH
ncbi:MAG TPA: condensation domain-containing protein, partial [Thermoanaerobaculia bacterium]|nr:condensation domain-containing protein [Thermoanaerobaculia bacterium]